MAHSRNILHSVQNTVRCAFLLKWSNLYKIKYSCHHATTCSNYCIISTYSIDKNSFIQKPAARAFGILTWKLLFFGSMNFLKTKINEHNALLYFVSKKAEGRISKQKKQENKAQQIFIKKTSYCIIGILTRIRRTNRS